jgi:hypothetical protein
VADRLGNPKEGRAMPSTMIRRSRTLVAGLCFTAAAAAVLTAYVVVLLVQWNVLGPPPDLEGPSAFGALLLVSMYASWGFFEALVAWAVFVHALNRFPYVKRASVGVLALVAVTHALLTASLAGAEPWVLIVIGAAVPLALAGAVLLALAPGRRGEGHNTP